ncbi:uncharacterized protein LOC115034802 [Acyrthosiphon pisum]|uniref:DDE Tnp4 domain-containing protein n=1 Tax=Acyrthosiphon pisum TaxID=7029 RepID=A0A8R2NVW0_ACYPI|nr:uncharacterized protein LOC115034802 [Acyrthosiphon pisum]
MKASCMPELTKKDWIEVAEIYKKKANFPHCLGPIDGKHIRIRKPSNTGSEYFNYKNYFSIVLMAVVDANYKFLVVDIGAYGKGSDSLVFQDSHFGQRLQRDELDLPQASIIDGYNEPVFPYVFLLRRHIPTGALLVVQRRRLVGKNKSKEHSEVYREYPSATIDHYYVNQLRERFDFAVLQQKADILLREVAAAGYHRENVNQ